MLRWRPRSVRAQWWVSFGLFTLLLSTWAFANPLFTGPDEHDHVRRAYSVVHGELIGTTRRGVPDHIRFVKVPTRYLDIPIECFAHRPEVTAECLPSINDRGGDDVARYALVNGRYPPTPFGMVGAPMLVVSTSSGVYLMRVLGAALCGALFASALLSLRETKAPWLAASGIAFALTPMVLFMAGVVNPSNLEIAGGVGVWASGLVLAAKARQGVVDGRIVTRTAIAAGVLVLARPLGMLWLGLAGAVVLLCCTKSAVRALIRSKLVRIWGVVVALLIGFELAWITFYDTLASKSPPGISADGLSNLEVFERTVGQTSTSYSEMIGRFGWQDTLVPGVTLVLWTAALGALFVVAVGLTGRRVAALISGLAGSVVLVPALLEFIEARRFGFGWQGRYTLPLAVGLPILCGFALAQERRPALHRKRLVIVIAIAFVVAQFLAFWQNLRRYTVGYNGPLLFWRVADWSPPIPSVFLLAAYASVLIALAFWLWREDPAGPSETPADAEITTPA